MIDLTDPSMKEIVDEFCDETNQLLDELEGILEEYEDEPSLGLLEKYGQTIDRVMGTAQTIGANQVGQLCQMGKIIGYKSSQNDDDNLNNIVCGILFDLVDILREVVKNLHIAEPEHKFNVEAFMKRLNWLKEKFVHIDRASCDFEEGNGGAAITSELESLINSLKL
ncbi:MAG: hypothetical protein GY909_02995 [Oligoflexia bacterium]|nr:hypothetical protein [Oligoflexia bacterium]